MSEELSDTDSVNSELNNSICYVNNVNSKSDTDENCKGKSKLNNTNCMNDRKTDSLANTWHKTLQQSTSNKITSTHYVNTMMDNTTNIGTIESEHFHELTPKDQDTNTHYVNMVTDNITNIDTIESKLNFNELTPTGKTENYVLLNSQHFNNNSDQDNLNNNIRPITNIAGKEAKPQKAPRFIFPFPTI